MKREFFGCVLIGSVGLVAGVGCQEIPEGPYPFGEPAIVTYGGEEAVDMGEGRETTAPAGSLLGVSGSFIIGQQVEKNDPKEAAEVSKSASVNPASPAQARQSATGDLNKDGFVTLDEVVAMSDAGLEEEEIVKRLRATGQVFEVTSSQEEYLLNHGVNRTLADRIRALGRPTTVPAQGSQGL